MKSAALSILYVDDDQEDQEIFQEVVLKIQPALNCLIASDGKEAFEILSSIDELPAAIYLDMNMPIQNGLEVLKELKRHSKYQAIPTFLLTTSTSSQHFSEANCLGASGYFVKPTTLQQFENLLRPLLALQ
jgi:CheY-like chemotaxis protein